MLPLLATRGAAIAVTAGNVSRQLQPCRRLNVHEHVSMQLLRDAGVPVPQFFVCHSAEEAAACTAQLATSDGVVKAQVLTGGRGKGVWDNGARGGVKLVFSPDEAREAAAKMIGHKLVTKQTGQRGQICRKVLVCERKFPRKEFYVAIMMERAFQGPVMIASKQGGVNIEEVAEQDPDAIHKEPIDIHEGLTEEKAGRVVDALGLGDRRDEVVPTLQKLFELFQRTDASMIEINPLAEDTFSATPGGRGPGQLFCLDAKMRFDDNAEYRQGAVFAERDSSQEDPREVEAASHNLNYITLDGNIGCLVNGAGLAMATMDIIQLNGGAPANFLDVGGGANANQVKEAFKIITGDAGVHAILVNIFGGIMRCDVIAEGVVAAARELALKVPIVCRLQGTNVEDAKALIAASGMRIIAVDNLDEAASMAVRLSSIVSLARSAQLNVKFELPV